MAQILFIADVPANSAVVIGEPVHSARWLDFLEAAGESKRSAKDDGRIGESSWLLDATGSWRRANELTNAADRCQISYRVFLIEGAVTELTKPELRNGSAKPLRM